MSVKIQTLGLTLSYTVIVLYFIAVKLQETGTSAASVSGNQTQCERVNQTITDGKAVPECYCDSKCPEYRDCCPKAAFTGDTSKPYQNCTSFANGNFYVKKYGSQLNDTMKKKCAMNYTYWNLKNMKKKVPLTSLKTGLTYGNKACAAGFEAYNVSNFQLWNLNVTCNDFDDFLTIPDQRNPYLTIHRNLTKQFKYNNSSKTWQITLANGIRNCTLRPAVPDSLKLKVRPCTPNVINECSTNMAWLQPYCDQCQSIYFDANSSKHYRNKNCAWCSGAIANAIILNDCDPSGSHLLPLKLRTTPTTATPTPTVGTVPPVTLTQISTASTRRPRPTRPRPTLRPSTTPSPAPKVQVVDHSYIHVSIPGENYSDTLYEINMTKILTQTVYYTSLSRTYVRNFTEIEGSKLQTCDTSDVPKALDDNHIPRIVPIAFNIVLLLASAFLGLSIRHFVVLQSLNNYQYRYIMSSYTIALLLGNGGWIFKNISNNSVDDLFNPFDHVVTYFAFVASLMCTVTMAFHISCTLWKAFYQFSSIKIDSHSTYLYLYLTVNWFVSAIVTMIENSTFGSNSEENENGNLRLLIFFILPFIVVSSANFSFYVNSAILLGVEKAVEEKLQKLEINFKFFSALLGITHLMWLVALSFCYFKSYLLMALFHVLNLIVCLLVYCIASGSKFLVAESVQFVGDKKSLIIANKAE